MGRKADVQRVAKGRYWREPEARVLVQAWRSSGEGLSSFAKRHGITRQRLGRWANRLQGAEQPALRFHPVRLMEGVEDPAPIEIQLAGGRRIRVARGFATEDLRRVVQVLEEAPRC